MINTRDTPDDGVFTALLLAPLVSTVMLIYTESLASLPTPSSNLLGKQWIIEDPLSLPNSRKPLTPFEALILSRRNLVQLMTLTSGILLVHIFTFHYQRYKYAQKSAAVLPKNESRRTMSYVGFTAILTAGALLLKAIFMETRLNVWPGW